MGRLFQSIRGKRAPSRLQPITTYDKKSNLYDRVLLHHMLVRWHGRGVSLYTYRIGLMTSHHLHPGVGFTKTAGLHYACHVGLAEG